MPRNAVERRANICQHCQPARSGGTMESDSIRPSGSNTIVDMWIDGKLRQIVVPQEAIGAFLGFDRAEGMTENDRCEFVRTHLALLVTAAKTKLSGTNAAADSVVVDGAHLAKLGSGPARDRRKDERRKADRRKSNRPLGNLPDRRRSDRRKGERRASPREPSES